MESPEIELIKRVDDLHRRCERQSDICHTAFLTPAEVFSVESHCVSCGYKYDLFGGAESCERKILFLLPFWADDSGFSHELYISAVHITAYYGSPGHRDYLGALLGLGIERDSLGDLIIKDSEAYFFCLSSVAAHLSEISKVGRVSVKARLCPIDAVPPPVINCKSKSFSVLSPRLDAVIAEIFNISRSAACSKIEEGLVSLNYSVCLKTDKAVCPQDIISLRGHGKARIVEFGSLSKKGRRFITSQIYK